MSDESKQNVHTAEVVVRVGRPWFDGKDVDEVIGKLEYAFSFGANVKQACLFADISRDSYYNFIKYRPELSDRFKTLRETPFMVALHTRFLKLQSDAALAHAFIVREEDKKARKFQKKSEIEQKDMTPELLNLIKAQDDAILKYYQGDQFGGPPDPQVDNQQRYQE